MLVSIYPRDRIKAVDCTVCGTGAVYTVRRMIAYSTYVGWAVEQVARLGGYAGTSTENTKKIALSAIRGTWCKQTKYALLEIHSATPNFFCKLGNRLANWN